MVGSASKRQDEVAIDAPAIRASIEQKEKQK